MHEVVKFKSVRIGAEIDRSEWTINFFPVMHKTAMLVINEEMRNSG